MELRNLGLSLGGRAILSGLSLKLRPGRITGVVGANGSGKSSFLKAIAGVLPSQGEIVFESGWDREHLSYMPQDSVAPAAMTALEVVLLGRLRKMGLKVKPQDLQAVQQVLNQLGIAALAGQSMQTLSGGQRQMVFLAQALVSSPALLLLDEPTSALDIRHQLQVLRAVHQHTAERQLLTLLVIHDLNAAMRFCDRLLLLHGGRLLAYDIPQKVLSCDHVATAFGIAVETLISQDGTPVLSPLHALESV